MTDQIELVSAIQRRQVMIIVGAGVAIDASNRCLEASWVGLLRSGIRHLHEKLGNRTQNDLDKVWADGSYARLGLETSDALELSYVADQLRERMTLIFGSEDEFGSWLSQAIKRVDDESRKPDAPKDLALAVTGLRCPLATTNYDRILEHYTGFEALTMNQEEKVGAFIRNELSGVLHLHGVADRPRTIVLGRQSYRDYIGSMVKAQFQRSLSTISSCVFVGFGEGLHDLNFAPWFKWIAQTLNDSKIKHYVLLNDAKAAAWPTQIYPNIRPIAYGTKHSDLPPFLARLKADADELSKKPRPVSVRVVTLPGMGDQLLRDKITTVRKGKEAVAQALHQFVLEKFIASGLHYYATKYRIKSFNSTWNKVHAMALDEPLMDILSLVDQVRDIIGIRVVTLYRLDLKNAVQAVASWLSTSQVDAHAPFLARLEKARIHGHEAPNQDIDSPLNLAAALSKYFSEIGVASEKGLRPIASSYSAVHLLCSYVGQDGRRAFFEIQLRSALEDIWSEIEHALRYKPMDQGQQRAEREAADLHLARYHLLSLKTLVDGATQYADTIRMQLDRLMPIETRRLTSFTQNRTSRLDTLLASSSTSRDFRQRFVELFNRQVILLKGVADNSQPRGTRGATSEGLLQLARDYAALMALVPQVTLKQGFDRVEIGVMVRLEEALCVLEGVIRHPVEPERKGALKPALNTYSDVLKTLEAQRPQPWSSIYRPVALYRLALVRTYMNMLDDAISLGEAAYAAVIARTVAHPADHANDEINLEIAHFLIWVLQERAEDWSVIATENNEPDYKMAERKELHRRMAAVAIESLAKLHERDEEFVNAALYAAAEYSSAGGQVWETDVATETQIRSLIHRFDLSRVIEEGDSDTVHTAFRLSQHVLGDADLTTRAAKRLRRLLQNIQKPEDYQLRDLAQVERWLADHEET